MQRDPSLSDSGDNYTCHGKIDIRHLLLKIFVAC